MIWRLCVVRVARGSTIVALVILSYPPKSYPQLISSLCGKWSVRRGEAPAPAPRKSASGGGAGGGGAGGGGGACATSITTPGSPRFPRKANSAAAASTLAAVSSVVAYNNKLNGGPLAVNCDNDGNNGNSNSNGNGKGDGNSNGGVTRCNNNNNNSHNIQQSTKWGDVGSQLQ